MLTWGFAPRQGALVRLWSVGLAVTGGHPQHCLVAARLWIVIATAFEREADELVTTDRRWPGGKALSASGRSRVI